MRNCYQILGIHKRDNFDKIQEGLSKKLSELQDYYDKYTNIKGTQETHQEQERELNEHYQREIEKIAEAREILSNGFTRDAYNIGIEHGYYKGEEKAYREIQERESYRK